MLLIQITFICNKDLYVLYSFYILTSLYIDSAAPTLQQIQNVIFFRNLGRNKIDLVKRIENNK